MQSGDGLCGGFYRRSVGVPLGRSGSQGRALLHAPIAGTRTACALCCAREHPEFSPADCTTPTDFCRHGLTPHETRLLSLLVEGHNFKTAAAEAGVSPRAQSPGICAAFTKSCMCTPSPRLSPKLSAIGWF